MGLRHTLTTLTLATAALTSLSCGDSKPDYRPASQTNYPDLGTKQVPDYLANSIYQYTELRGAEPARVQGFGLVVNCDPVPNSSIEPGSQLYPTAVREYMSKEMVKRGVGSPNTPGWENYTPERMLADPRNAIVRVQALIPPGARGGKSMDIEVSALTGSTIKSLARGWLYQCDLSPRGGDTRAPGVDINLAARAEGQVFVNPALALNTTVGSTGQRATLREGLILDGGYIVKDRPLILQLRTPQRSLARKIEMRIDQAFQDSKAASAKDEGIVEVYVPEKFGNDWQHFAGVMRYLFMNENPAFPVLKAQELAAEAMKPDAPLADISYAWEGLGSAIIPIVQPLMSNPNPDIAFAAARAAAFVGDLSAQDVLVSMAETPGFKFQINAVHVLGTLPGSPAIDQKVRNLLNASDNLVRIEAYKMLALHKDSSILTDVVATGNEKFVLDLVPSSGPPLIFASRSGIPRIAVIGAKPSLLLPLFFSALDNRLTMTSSQDDSELVTIYYRGHEFPDPVTLHSRADLAEVIRRLGGEGPVDEAKLDFGYGDVVGLLQSLADSHKLVARYDGKQVAATFVLQELQPTPDDIRSAPLLPGQRPQANAE